MLQQIIFFSTFFFFFNDTATTEIYTLSLHDALPSSRRGSSASSRCRRWLAGSWRSSSPRPRSRDRKSTRLNSSHNTISYAVFCLKKKNKNITQHYILTRTTKKKK